jgi:hypothetical protein
MPPSHRPRVNRRPHIADERRYASNGVAWVFTHSLQCGNYSDRVGRDFFARVVLGRRMPRDVLTMNYSRIANVHRTGAGEVSCDTGIRSAAHGIERDR